MMKIILLFFCMIFAAVNAGTWTLNPSTEATMVVGVGAGVLINIYLFYDKIRFMTAECYRSKWQYCRRCWGCEL